jgi:hypothetical protein
MLVEKNDWRIVMVVAIGGGVCPVSGFTHVE